MVPMTTMIRGRSWRGSRWVDRAFATLLAIACLAFGALVAGALTGFRVLTIQSGSMTPALRTGDLVVSRSRPVALIHPGDIVTFEHPTLRAMVTHRVVETTRDGDTIEVTTKGDANTVTEAWHVPANARIGRTVLRIPGVAPPTRTMIIRLGSVSAIVALGGYLGFQSLRRIWQAPA